MEALDDDIRTKQTELDNAAEHLFVHLHGRFVDDKKISHAKQLPKTKNGGNHLSDNRGKRNARNAHGIDKQKVQNNVDNAGHNQKQKRGDGIAQTS